MAYGSGTNTANNIATGDNNIDGLLADERWKSTEITFSFTDNFNNDYEEELGYANSNVHGSSFSSLDATQKAMMRDWKKMYENVSNLDLTELTGNSDRNATIRIAKSDDPATAYAYKPNDYFAEGGDVWFNNSEIETPTIGDYSYYTYGHELGHALGLEHGHEKEGVSNVALNSNRDSMEFSIMTYRSYEGAPTDFVYNGTYSFAQSLMIYDIRAIQEMYGANFSRNSDDTTYRFSPNTGEMFVDGAGRGKPGDNRVFRTVWDGNGIDTYNFFSYTTDLAIDLIPGRWSDLDRNGNFQRANLGNGNYARGHIFNALQFEGDMRSLIENANGGSGDDSIRGNDAENRLRGNGGNDTLNGGNGDDTLIGNRGNDFLTGSAGRDRLNGGQGNDRLNGGRGDDTLIGKDGKDDFVFDTGTTFDSSDLGVDTIVDFAVTQDKVRLSKDTFTALDNTSNGELQNADFEIVTSFVSAQSSSAEIVYNSASGNLFYNPNNSAIGFGEGGLFANFNRSPDNLSNTNFRVVDL